MGTEKLTRRGALAALAGAGVGSGVAQAAGGGRAVVSIYLTGGADTNNLIVPLDRSYTAYARGRGALALARTSLLAVRTATSGRSFGFHPAARGLKDLFERRLLGVVANVGGKTAPATPGHRMEGVRFVRGGFLAPRYVQAAWGGSSFFTFRENGLSMSVLGGGGTVTADSPSLLGAARAATLRTVFPRTSLGRQLELVARLLRSGAGGQVFCCNLGGFDTHTRQLERQVALFTELSEAMAAFYEATVEMGIAGLVTTYTDTEFNREMTPNATQGTGHGWGGHHLVMGGSVVGGEVHGTFPDMAVGGSGDATGRGAWIPSTARERFEATVAAWAGIPLSDLSRVYSELLGAASPTLPFLVG
ncbi:MAG: DUF1501 domain-containing protein [Bryobacteraceae bacterium]|nr:DUF1501 domain-containing protein [Bryobacteraceae bacterium]